MGTRAGGGRYWGAAVSERDKKRIICTPEDYERVRGLLSAAGLAEHYLLLTSETVPPGTAVLMQSEAEFEEQMQRAGWELHDGLVRKLERQLEEDTKALRAKLHYDTASQLVYGSGLESRRTATSWLGVVTGL